jgi:transcriptional regulator with XRE-family HTH domain
MPWTYLAVVGRILEGLRKKNGIDQEKMARAMGIAQSTWSRVENGTIGIGVEQLSKAARVLKSTPGEILTRSDVVIKALPIHGVRVEMERVEDPIDMGMLLVGGAALSALIILILAGKRG